MYYRAEAQFGFSHMAHIFHSSMFVAMTTTLTSFIFFDFFFLAQGCDHTFIHVCQSVCVGLITTSPLRPKGPRSRDAHRSRGRGSPHCKHRVL